jgi:hypothetical protein
MRRKLRDHAKTRFSYRVGDLCRDRYPASGECLVVTDESQGLLRRST